MTFNFLQKPIVKSIIVIANYIAFATRSQNLFGRQGSASRLEGRRRNDAVLFDRGAICRRKSIQLDVRIKDYR